MSAISLCTRRQYRDKLITAAEANLPHDARENLPGTHQPILQQLRLITERAGGTTFAFCGEEPHRSIPTATRACVSPWPVAKKPPVVSVAAITSNRLGNAAWRSIGNSDLGRGSLMGTQDACRGG